MGFLSMYDGTERVELGDGYWVEIKRCLSVMERQAAERSLIAVEMIEDETTGKNRTKINPDIVTNTFEMVLASVVDWNLTDQNDELLGLKPESELRRSLGRIPGKAFDKISAAVRENNKEESSADEAQFPAGDDGSAEGGVHDEPGDIEVLSGGGDMAAAGASSGPAATV